MKSEKSARKPRSDGQKNRELILQVAKQAFTENGAGSSLDDIAKTAGVGAGTLYRHFPTRQALLESVYLVELEKLAEAAGKLGQELPPMDALRDWLYLFIDYLATKKVIAAALTSLVGDNQVIEQNMNRIHDPVRLLFEKAIESRDIRPDVNPGDLMRAIVGVIFFGPGEDGKESATRVVDILLAGSRF